MKIKSTQLIITCLVIAQASFAAWAVRGPNGGVAAGRAGHGHVEAGRVNHYHVHPEARHAATDTTVIYHEPVAEEPHAVIVVAPESPTPVRRWLWW